MHGIHVCIDEGPCYFLREDDRWEMNFSMVTKKKKSVQCLNWIWCWSFREVGPGIVKFSIYLSIVWNWLLTMMPSINFGQLYGNGKHIRFFKMADGTITFFITLIVCAKQFKNYCLFMIWSNKKLLCMKSIQCQCHFVMNRPVNRA